MENTTPTIVNQPIKFSDDETKEISEIRQSYDQAVVIMGQLYLQKMQIEKNEVELKREYASLESREKAFLDKIVAKYGEGNYDQKTNIFTPKSK